MSRERSFSNLCGLYLKTIFLYVALQSGGILRYGMKKIVFVPVGMHSPTLFARRLSLFANECCHIFLVFFVLDKLSVCHDLSSIWIENCVGKERNGRSHAVLIWDV